MSTPKDNPTSLSHSGTTNNETAPGNLLGSQKNLVGSSYYAQNLFSQPYENGFQFISLNKGLTHKTETCGLLNEVDTQSTINFDAEDEPFQADEVEETP